MVLQVLHKNNRFLSQKCSVSVAVNHSTFKDKGLFEENIKLENVFINTSCTHNLFDNGMGLLVGLYCLIMMTTL